MNLVKMNEKSKKKEKNLLNPKLRMIILFGYQKNF